MTPDETPKEQDATSASEPPPDANVDTEARDVAGGIPAEHKPTKRQRLIALGVLAAILVVTLVAYFAYFRPRTAGQPSGDHSAMAMAPEGTDSAGGSMDMDGSSDATPVEVATARMDALSQYVTYSGTVLPLYEEVVYPRVTGWVEAITVDEGAAVHAGQVVVRLDDTELQARAEAARAGYDQAVEAAHAMDASVSEAEAKLAQDRAVLRRAEAKVTEDEGVVAQYEAQLSAAASGQRAVGAALQSARADARGQQAKLTKAESAKAEADSQIERREADLRQARSDRTQADASRASAQAKLDYWQREFAREDKLFEVGAISEEEHDRAKESLRVAEERVRETEAATRSADERIAAASAGADSARARSRGAAAEVTEAKERLLGAEATVTAAVARVAQAEAGVDGAEAALAQARAKLRQGGERVREVRALIDQDEARILMARAEARQARAGITGARQTYQAERSIHQYTIIRAQTSGTVSRRLVDKGTLVSPGMPLLKIASMNAVRIQVKVSERHLALISQGNPVRVGTADGGHIDDVTVTTVFPEEDAATKTGIVEIILDNADARLKLNSYVTCEIDVAERSDAVQVDPRAVFEVDGQSYVYRVANGTVRKTAVSVGVASSDGVEILDGLVAGDQVVVVGLRGLVDGAKVTVREAPEHVPPISEDQMVPGEPRMATPALSEHEGMDMGSAMPEEGTSH